MVPGILDDPVSGFKDPRLPRNLPGSSRFRAIVGGNHAGVITSRRGGGDPALPRRRIATRGDTVIKFMVVCYRRPDWSRDQFRRYFDETHGPLAMTIPGVRRYVQNFVEPDERRDPPWDAVIEFWFDDSPSMEAAWHSEAGRLATADNANLMDLSRTRWAVVEEIVVRAEGSPPD
jgi:uncharacterized protein (TIGR02118 family)